MIFRIVSIALTILLLSGCSKRGMEFTADTV